MKPLNVRTIIDVTGGALRSGDAGLQVDSVSTDTRALKPGALFVALRGERFDANEFAPAAVGAGAAAVIVERWTGGDWPASAAVIEVADGLLALQKLAAWYRRQLDILVVGVTGSNGKTSTKDFTRAVLEQGFRVGATRGNLNNHIGVPLTVLSLDAGDTAAVIEMGMNHPGEIEPLCEIARPTLGIITNIGTAHIEHLGSRDGIAEEKGALARSLPADGMLFVPAGCSYFEYFKSRSRARVVPVGNGRGLIRAEKLCYENGRSKFSLVIDGRVVGEVDLPVLGRHMVKNALLAAGCGWALGLDPGDIVRGLSNAVLTDGRLRRYESGGVTVFDDTYNANPESMAAALETLAEYPVANGARRHVVLGPMGELGAHAPEAHRSVGRLAVELGFTVTAVGADAEGIADGAGRADYFADPDEAARELPRRIAPGDLVLFKASRGAAMERVMNQAFPPSN
jgi:UDP-N-acetylmuramoyl-tripeptide--D-alanyl-D-alanine ligase